MGGQQHHGNSEQARTMAMPGIEIGALSRHQMNQVIEAGAKVAEFLAQGNSDAVSAAFYGVQYNLTQVDATVLTGEASRQWQELSMRLHNDAVEGSEAATTPQQRRAADSLKQNLVQLEQHFGLGHAHAGHGPPSLSEELKAQLVAVMQAYLALQKALADDNGQEAITAATDMQKSLEAVDMSLFDTSSHDLWMKAQPIIKAALPKFAAAHDLQSQREGFLPISQQMIGLSQALGAVGADTVFVMHCPMAFDNRGASWLQDDEELLNPYFGAAMLRCGTVEEVIPSR